MYPREIRVNNPSEALVVEQALALAREMQRVAQAAPHGKVLEQVEQVVMTQGRELLRQSLEVVLNTQAPEVEKKGLPSAPVPAGRRGNIEGATRAASSRRPGR